MKIAVIGAGAMGSIYGGHLSQKHDVCIVDTNNAIVEAINANGLKIEENGQVNTYYPRAVTSTENETPADLVIVFVKAIFSKAALEGNKNLIGENTHLMTLQNGAGHEDLLSEFVKQDKVIIGTTEDNGAVLGAGHVRRGGTGKTNVGMLCEDKDGFLNEVKAAFDECGFTVAIHENIQKLIWEKLFTNVSLSAVTGIMQIDMGEIYANPHAWEMTKQLIHEAILTAKAAGLEFNEEEWTEKVKQMSVNNPNGCTSIRADLRDGRKTEVNTITGAVIKFAEKYGCDVPTHKFVRNMVHAMEYKKERKA